MRATLPLEITPMMVLSSSAPEIHTPPEWDSGETYPLGAIRKVAGDYKIYESLEPDNQGNPPGVSPLWWRVLGPTETPYSSLATYPLGATCSHDRWCFESLAADNTGHPLPVWPERKTAWWINVATTNKWAMFDLSRTTQTVTEGPLTVRVALRQRANTIGIGGMRGNSLEISATSVTGGGAVYPNGHSRSKTGVFDLNTRQVNNYYEFAFEPFSTRASHVIFDLPPYSDIIVTVTLSSSTGNVKCGSMVFGTYIFIGSVIGPVVADTRGFTDYTYDNYGNKEIVVKRSLPLAKLKLRLPSYLLNKVNAAKMELEGKVALWTGLDDPALDWFDTLQIFGVWTKFAFGNKTNNHVEIDLETEEM